jgi:membrane-bound lytic murein transglycosylase A
VRLHDGRLLRVGYAGSNGHPYRAVGRPLLESGAVPRERMSMQAIRAWLAAAGPGDAAALLRHNPSYVFFRVLEGLPPGQGAPGALGVPLTAGRSLAVDSAFIPFGAPVFAVTRDPVDGKPIRRLLHAQDTGGAIRGPARGDLFWGWGEAAAARAGLMREAAEVFVLVPRERAPGEAEERPVAP